MWALKDRDPSLMCHAFPSHASMTCVTLELPHHPILRPHRLANTDGALLPSPNTLGFPFVLCPNPIPLSPPCHRSIVVRPSSPSSISTQSIILLLITFSPSCSWPPSTLMPYRMTASFYVCVFLATCCTHKWHPFVFLFCTMAPFTRDAPSLGYKPLPQPYVSASSLPLVMVITSTISCVYPLFWHLLQPPISHGQCVLGTLHRIIRPFRCSLVAHH